MGWLQVVVGRQEGGEHSAAGWDERRTGIDCVATGKGEQGREDGQDKELVRSLEGIGPESAN